MPACRLSGQPGHRARHSSAWVLLLSALCLVALGFLPGVLQPVAARETLPEDRLVEAVLTLAKPVLEDQPTFGFSVRAWLKPRPLGIRVEDGVEPKPEKEVGLDIARLGTASWGIQMTSPWRDVLLRRDEDHSWLGMARARRVFHGVASLTPAEAFLVPQGLLGRLVTWETSLATVLALVGPGTLEQGVRSLLLPRLHLLEAQRNASASTFLWTVNGSSILRLTLDPEPRVRFDLASGSGGLKGLCGFEVWRSVPRAETFRVPDDWERREVPRADLERLVFRGLKRMFSILLPGPEAERQPAPASTSHGDVLHKEGQVVVRLWGKPDEIGKAHAELLRPFIRRTIDSTLYVVGLVTTIEKGEWFFDVLEDCWRRVRPHLPERHVAELAAMASGCPDLTWQETRLASIFPEFFHCSGFALFGRATASGTLYHGRVLDYMTEIGLQQAAVTFVIKPEGQFGFISPGFAGFHGSVTGMNERQIALGEMGGGGRGLWDGAPMTTLMRRALEECETLDQVKKLWTDNPRTCEYYYVFSDGKIPDAVAVKATPEKVEFLEPGQPHPQLGEGIADAVVLSAGNRLKLLRERVKEGYGRFDEAGAIGLMARPVAMKSNLHDALFVPQRLEAWVAQAGTDRPAAEGTYVRFSLRELLESLPR